MIGRQLMFGVKNRYTIVKNDKTITLVSLTPKQVYDNQIKLKGEYEAIRKENKGEEQGERRPSESARTQNITEIHSVTHPNINKYLANLQTNQTIYPLPKTPKSS
jgi:hypothetical protein